MASRMDASSSSAAVRRKQKQGERDYKRLQEERSLVYQMLDYNEKYGNDNDKNPF